MQVQSPNPYQAPANIGRPTVMEHDDDLPYPASLGRRFANAIIDGFSVLARTAIRCIPFEPFSFLGSDPEGWHDNWSKTRVVPVHNPYSDI